MQTPKDIDLEGAVDLSRVNELNDERKRLDEEAAMEEALKVAAKWDKAMTRAFKGVVSRRQRHLFLSKLKENADA